MPGTPRTQHRAAARPPAPEQRSPDGRPPAAGDGQPTSDDPGGRPLRRDAARNHQRILAEAGRLVSEHGVDVSMELIAQRAGLGVGTLYRRFPNKDALLDALVEALVLELVAAAGAALAHGDGSGLEEFLRTTARTFVDRRGCLARLWGRTRVTPGALQVRQAIADLVAQAREHGAVAPDITTEDVVVLLWALRGIVVTAGDLAPQAWERHLDLHLAGLRLRPVASARPPLSPEQVHRIAHEQAAPAGCSGPVPV